MFDKKPPDMTWETFVEYKIQAAQAEGAFDNLPGFGRPIPGLDEPPDDLWWIKNLLARENLSTLPVSLQIRWTVEKTLQRIASLADETEVRRQLAELNDAIRQANRASLTGPPSTTSELDIEEAVAHWRGSRETGSGLPSGDGVTFPQGK